MASFGSLIFYKKNGVSEPFSLSYGKTTIGSSESHHIRIKDEAISCILDSNEVGVTILLNENEHDNIRINNKPTGKYMVLRNEDLLEVGEKKFKYSNPSLKDEYLQQAQETLNKKVGTMKKKNSKSKLDINPLTPSKRLQKDTALAKHRRFSTGSKLATVKNSPKNIGEFLSSRKPNVTSQSPSIARFSRRMLAKRNSTLASVMENEVFDFQNSKNTIPQSSFRATLESPSARKNKTFTGTGKFSSPIPAKNKTYSGNISDVSESIATTPENNVTVDSITPLNISKKAKKSLNRSRTLSYVDFPNSSTPKSAIRMNRSSSLYRPLVEDITPASPVPRSSLRNSSLKKLAFMQRRSVNFNISSSSDHSSQQASDSIALEESLVGSKRKRSDDVTVDPSASSGSLKKMKSIYDNGHEDLNSVHDSSISDIQNLSNNDHSIEDESTNISTSINPKKNISSNLRVDSDNQSIVSFNLEVSSTDMNMSGISNLSSVTKTPQKSRRSIRLSNLNLSNNSFEKIDQAMGDNLSKYSDVEESQYSRKILKNSSTSNLESILVDSLNESSKNSSFSQPSKSRRHSIIIQDTKKGNIRSKSLNLRRLSKTIISKHSKTLGGNVGLDHSEENSLENICPTPTLQTPPIQLSKTKTSRSKSLNMGGKASNSRHVPTKASVSMNLDLSPMKTSSLNNSLEDLKSVSSRSTRSSLRPHGKEKIRSKSLTLRTNTRKSLNVHSKTLDSYNTPNISDQKSFRTESRNKSSSSLYVPANISTSMTLNISPIKSNHETIDNVLNETDSVESVQSTSTSSSVFIHSMSEINDMNELPASRSIYNTGDSVTPGGSRQKSVESPMIRLTRSFLNGQNTGSPACSRLRSRSQVVSDISLSNFSSVSSNISSCYSSGIDDSNSDVFKTPNIKKAPRKLVETPNLFSKSTDDPTNIKPTEELLHKNSEKIYKRSHKSSDSNEGTDVDDRESVDTSFSKSFKSVGSGSVQSPEKMSRENFSFEVSSRRTTPRKIKNLTGYQNVPNIIISNNSPKNDSNKVRGIQKSPQNDLSDVRGVKKLLKTPRVQKSPRNDLTNLGGLKKLMKTPKVEKSPNNDLTNIKGIKKLLNTPKVQKSPRNDLSSVGGIKKLMKTPSVKKSPKNDLRNVAGLKKLMNTPKIETSPKNDLTSVKGVKKLMQTPKVQKPPKNDLTDVGGVKKLMKTPKIQKSPNNDLTNVGGVKKLMKTPKIQKSPKNDLTNVGGVKKLMKTPKIQKSPKNDLTNVGGVKKLMTTPKLQKSPKNDLTKVSGLKKLMASPKHQKSPKNDLTDVKGITKILKTPRMQKSPKNELLDVRGIKNLLRTPKNKDSDDSHDLSGIDILFNESRESNFDKLLEKKPPRTYSRSPKLNSNDEQLNKPETPEHVLKWLEDQSNLEPAIKVENSRGKRKIARTSDASQENAVTPNKKPKTTRSTRAYKDVKPSCTPSGNEEKSDQNTSQAEKTETDKETEQIGTRRAKRKLESHDEVDTEPIMRRTRGKNRIINEAKGDEKEIKALDNRKHKTKQVKQKVDSAEQPSEEIITRPRRGKKPKDNNEDQISLDTIKTTENKQSPKQTNKKETEKNNLMEEESTESIKNTRKKRGKLQVENIVNKEESTSSKKVKIDTEQENSKVDYKAEPKPTNRNKKQVEEILEESKEIENIESIPRGKRNRIAKKKEEKSKDIENEIEPKRRGRRNKKEDEKTTDIEIDRNTNTEEIVEDVVIKKESTSHKKTKNSKETESEQSKDGNEPVKKITRRTKTENANSVNDEEPKLQPKKNTRSKKIEDPVSEETDIGKTTRSNKGKNKKYNDEEWDTPGKKQDKKRVVTFKDEVENSQTPTESNTVVVRTLRKRRNLK